MTFKPTTKEELQTAVNLYCNNKYEGINKYGIIEEWNVSLINDMSYLFQKKYNFNSDISNWNVSNVTNMFSMFCECTNFNQPLNNWNISNVINMEDMFSACNKFNQPLNNWNVSNVVDMSCMFWNCKSFNQPLNNWNVSNVTNMFSMFCECTNFNQPLNNWNISNVINMEDMFSACNKFNQPLNNWNVSNVVDMNGMFCACNKFNQPLNNWNVSNVIDIDGMFCECEKFNQSIIMWDIIPNDISINNSLINILNDLFAHPHKTIQKNNIINNIMNTSTINYIWNHEKELMITKYKNIFEGYKIPYKIVNYNVLCTLEYLGIKICDAIDYSRFTNKLLVDLHINKKNTIINSLIIHIKEADIERYNCLTNDLNKLFTEQLNKKVNIMICNDNILLSDLEE